MVDYSGCRSRNTRRVFPAPSSSHQFFGIWSTPGTHFLGGTLYYPMKVLITGVITSLRCLFAKVVVNECNTRFLPTTIWVAGDYRGFSEYERSRLLCQIRQRVRLLAGH